MLLWPGAQAHAERNSVPAPCALPRTDPCEQSGGSGRTRGFGVNDYAGTAGWARERLIAVRDATPAPGGDVTDLAVEVAAVYEELTAILPSARPTGDPREW